MGAMKKSLYFVCVICLLFSVTACQTVNEAVQGPSQAVGSVLAVPHVATQGLNAGYVDQTGASQANPYG